MKNTAKSLVCLVGVTTLLAANAMATTVFTESETSAGPSGSTANSLCGQYESYLLYDNNNTKFQPGAGETSCVVNVTVDGNPLPNTSYSLLWRYSLTGRGCASDSGTYDKTFTSDPTKKYTFTLYFKPGCTPPAGANVTMTITFQ